MAQSLMLMEGSFSPTGVGQCATYAGSVGYYPIERMAGHIIKTEEDLRIAEALLKALEMK